MKKCRKKYRRTKKEVIGVIFRSQKQSSKRRGHRPPEYTKKDILEWAFSQTLFHELYDEWVQSGYLTKLKPSIDRKCDDIHYCLQNIQLMTAGENIDKARRDQKTGKLFDNHRIVLQITKDDNIVNEFFSISEAHRVTGINLGNIGTCCSSDGRYTAGGFKWRYK